MSTTQTTPIADQASRQETLIKLLKQHVHVDVLNQEAVDAYVRETGAPVVIMPFGANKCAQFGRDLSRMHSEGLLKRYAAGLTGMSGMGFPRWVYSYQLIDKAA